MADHECAECARLRVVIEDTQKELRTVCGETSDILDKMEKLMEFIRVQGLGPEYAAFAEGK
jgi:hypothetical protein